HHRRHLPRRRPEPRGKSTPYGAEPLYAVVNPGLLEARHVAIGHHWGGGGPGLRLVPLHHHHRVDFRSGTERTGRDQARTDPPPVVYPPPPGRVRLSTPRSVGTTAAYPRGGAAQRMVTDSTELRRR